MRILILTQYFWPENFKINDIALALKERGHCVTVLTGKPNYPKGKFSEGYSFFNKRKEEWNDINIYRAFVVPRGKGRAFDLLLNYVTFALFASMRLMFIRREFDKILVFQPSPVTIGIPGILAKYKFKAAMYFWVQDLWPASISAAGGVKNRGVLAILNSLTIYIYHHAHKVLVQSKAFIPYIVNQNIANNKLYYFPNSTESYYKQLNLDFELNKTLPNGFKLMFAGNIGESQSFDTLMNAALLLKKENIIIYWIILGEGRMDDYVKHRVKELELQDNFLLLGAFPSHEMPRYFSCADALLVSLKKNPIFSYTIPSKIQSYLACGKPIIASLDGEGGRIIEEAQAGFVCPAEDPEALATIIKKFIQLDVQEQKFLGRCARLYFENEFEREMLIDKLEVILNK